MKENDKIAKENGFEDFEELLKLVAQVDLSTPKKLTSFETWKRVDGTKEGLLKLKFIK